MHIEEGLYKKIVESMPVLCVDLMIKNKEGKYLLMIRTNEPFKGQWWIPGGRVYKNESLESAVKRKVFEECGMKIDTIKNIGFIEYLNVKSPFPEVKTGSHVLSVVFEIIPKNYSVKTDSQHSEFKWFDKKSFPKGLNKMLGSVNI